MQNTFCLSLTLVAATCTARNQYTHNAHPIAYGSYGQQNTHAHGGHGGVYDTYATAYPKPRYPASGYGYDYKLGYGYFH